MEEQKTIKDYIVDYLLDGEDEKRLDPVLVEWLAEDESHRKEFNLYKKIWEEMDKEELAPKEGEEELPVQDEEPVEQEQGK